MNYIEQLQKAYYEGTPLISNEEYDALTRYVNEESIGSAGDIAHWSRMYSLDKKYPCRGDALPSNIKDYIKSDKLDGCAISILYYNGDLVRSLTRGDGIKGNDITTKVLLLGVPTRLENAPKGWLQVTGEVVVTEQVQNRRNFASGALNQKEDASFVEKRNEGGMTFVAYGAEMETVEGSAFPLYTDLMDWLAEEGFLVATKVTAEDLNIPTDGIVYRLNDMREFEALGWTNKFPRGAFAVKEDEEGVWTTLREVTWSVGKSGKVVPTAIFDEVIIDDARITRATLNNPGYMEGLGITDIGQEISVIRAGNIIPRIIGVKPYGQY